MALVEAGLFESRSKASAAIEAGLVSVDGRAVAKPSTLIRPGAIIEAEPAFPWVSRGGVKLAAGLDAFGIDPSGLDCLDLGASTGGFTEVLLSRGAAHVVAVDVGHDQLHARLRADRRVTVIEGCDGRDLDAARLGRLFHLMVCDVSFISLKLILPTVLKLGAPMATFVGLIKPQFEAGRGVVRKGLVRDPAIHAAVCEDVSAVVSGLGWTVLGVVPSPIEGGDGNREFLLGARRTDG